MDSRSSLLAVSALLTVAAGPAAAADKALNVVVTNSAYQSITEYLGGDKVKVAHIVDGNRDPHAVRPVPSVALMLRDADVYVATGMDLELWSPSLVDMSGNPNIRSGQKGYVSASAGLNILEVPKTLSRAEGDVHIYGNPHIHTNPLNTKIIAENICVGLSRNAPQHAAFFEQNLVRFKNEIDERVFGPQLVQLLGGKTLTSLAHSGRLIPFLQGKQHKGAPLLDLLGGWTKEALPLRGKKMVAYHKNITYFAQWMGLEIVAYLEPKPGIPPSPGHISSVLEQMKSQNIKVMWSESYFDTGTVKKVADKVGAVAVIVPLSPDNKPGTKDLFELYGTWIGELNKAFAQAEQPNL